MNSETKVKKGCEQSCRVKQITKETSNISVVNLPCTKCSELYCHLFNIVQTVK